MMKSFQKLVAAISAVVVGSLCMLSATALESRDIAAYLYQVEEWDYAPIRPIEGSYVNTYRFDHLVGLAVQCSDSAVLESGELDLPNGIRLDIQRADVFMQTYQPGDEAPVSNLPLTLPDDFSLSSEEFCVLSLPSEASIPALLADTRVTVLGRFCAQFLKKAWTLSNPDEFYIEPAEGTTIDEEALNTEAYHYLHQLDGNWETKEGLASVADAVAFCEQLEARDDIAFAWIKGYITNNLLTEEVQGYSVLPIEAAPSGDTNENGKLEATDAQLALQAYVAVQLANLPSPLTATQIAHADMDGDGAVSLQDAMEILQRYVATLVA